LKKSLYSWLLEKPRFYAAAAITAVTPAEEKVVRTFVPHYPGIVRCVSNPIELHDLEGQSWKGDIGAKRVVYLGRFDILHKGIDIMVDIARLLPDVEFLLYGTKDRQTKGWLESLQSNLPANVHFCDQSSHLIKQKC
jgi:glycosyltransferase involved in cell wall biosynthesis